MHTNNFFPARRLGWILLLAGLASCTEDPPVSLSGDDRVRIDTLYNRQITQVRLEMDSLCDASFRTEVDRAVDSMLQVRRAEEDALRRRIPREIEKPIN